MYYIEWEHLASGDRGVRPRRGHGNPKPAFFTRRSRAEQYARELNVCSRFYKYVVRRVTGPLAGGPYGVRKSASTAKPRNAA